MGLLEVCGPDMRQRPWRGVGPVVGDVGDA